MKISTYLKGLAFLLLLGLVWTDVSAQAPGTLEAKQELEAQSGANYDIWKASQFSQEVEPNKLLNTSISNGQMTYLVRLGWNLLNSDAASAYEAKLSDQPGVIAVTADHNSNTVEITIKEEDEHDALRSYFDIE